MNRRVTLSPLTSLPWVLASASPRRRRLLSSLGRPFQIHPVGVEEKILPGEAPVEFARRAALDKARAASREFPESLVIGADTVVHLDGKIFGKPADEKEAVSFLHELSGKTHTVTTGVALALASKSIEHVLHADSRVTFKTLSPETIRDYVESGEPMDKAGAYGIQGGGFALVESFSGEYANIVGFPLASFLEELKRFA